MERNTQKHGLINLLALLSATVAGLAVSRYGNSLAGQVSTLFLGLGAIVALVSWFQMRLEESERLESLELDEMAKSRGDSALFENREAGLFPARRSREQYERFFVPAITVLLAIGQGGGAYLVWRWLQRPGTAETALRQPAMVLAMFALFALILFLLGKFATTVARLENQRLLRPGASYSLLGAYICFAVTMGIVGVEAGFTQADFYVACGLCVLLGLVAVETVIQLILEIYRPRLKGKVQRPLYESRLVGLLGQPEGLVTTAAQALDYQFGFKVSETWFYRFLEQSARLDWCWCKSASLVLSTSFVFIDPGEQGLREHFGRQIEAVKALPGRPCQMALAHRQGPHLPRRADPGVHRRLRTRPGHGAGGHRGLDRFAHAKEEFNFLVAHREERLAANRRGRQSAALPVSLLTASIPVQYQIVNLTSDNGDTNTTDPATLLEKIADPRSGLAFPRQCGRRTGSCPIRRAEAAETLKKAIQLRRMPRNLGVRIVLVGPARHPSAGQGGWPPLTRKSSAPNRPGNRPKSWPPRPTPAAPMSPWPRRKAATSVNRAKADRVASREMTPPGRAGPVHQPGRCLPRRVFRRYRTRNQFETPSAVFADLIAGVPDQLSSVVILNLDHQHV